MSTVSDAGLLDEFCVTVYLRELDQTTALGLNLALIRCKVTQGVITSAVTCTPSCMPKSTSAEDDALLKLLVNSQPNQGKGKKPGPDCMTPLTAVRIAVL